MQRHISHVPKAWRRAAVLPRHGCLVAASWWQLAQPARWYTHQTVSDAHSQRGDGPLKQRSSSLASQGSRGRTTALSGKAPPVDVADRDEAIDPFRTTGEHSLGISAPASPPTDSPQQRQPRNHARRPTHPPRHPRHAAGTVTSAALLRSLEEQHSPLASTLKKRLVPRHTGPHGATTAHASSAHQTDEQRRATRELCAEEDRAIEKDGYDPALVVRTDARRRQVRLNHVQRELIWTARQQQYQDLLQRIVACLQSHRSPVEKCQTLFALHEEAIHHRLRLRADTYEDILHTLYSVGVQRGGGTGQPGRMSMSPAAHSVAGDAQWEKDLCGVEAAHVSGGSLPAELASAAAASSTVLSAHGMAHVWEMYRYAVDSGTNPTARMLQYVMGLLEHASVALAVSRSPLISAGGTAAAPSARHRARSSGLLLVEAKAHSLMMDADRFHLTPSEYTITSYVGVCEACDVMHLAAARVADYQTRHERQASAGMYARFITGLVRCGHYEDAMAMVTTMQNVPMTTYLLNAVLQAARHSRDPTSVFTFYRALFFAPANALRVEGTQGGTQRRAEPSARLRSRLAPSLATFSILVEVMQATERCTELDFVLAEMQHYRVKGNGLLLNKLLKLMAKSGKSPMERETLQRAMDNKHIRVFDESRVGPNTHALT